MTHVQYSLRALGLGLGLCHLVGCATSQSPSQAAEPVPAAVPLGAPKAVADAQQAFDALANKLEKLDRDEIVDTTWLRGELSAVLETDPSHPLARFNLA